MGTPIRSRHALPNADTTIDLRYPAGDKPIGGANLVWAAAGYAIINTLVINHAFAEDQTQFLSGPNAGIATYFLEQVAGPDNYATEGWTIPAGMLSHPSNSDQGSGTFRVGATDGVLTVYQPIDRPWAYLPPPEIQIKWNPGMYQMQLQDARTALSTYQSRAVEAATVTGLKGILWHIHWGEIETSRGVYDWTRLDGLRDACVSNGLRFAFIYDNNWFGSTNKYVIAPQYLETEPNAKGGIFSRDGGFRIRLDASGLVDRLLAFFNALGARYDSHAKFEGIMLVPDVSVLSGTIPPDYLGADIHHDQVNRLIENAQVAFPTSNVWIGLSGLQPLARYYSTVNGRPGLVPHCVANRVGIGGSDIAGAGMTTPLSTPPAGVSNAMRATLGYIYNGSQWVTGGTNFQAGVSMAPDIEGHELGGKENGFSCQAIYAHGHDTLQVSHYWWQRKDFAYAQYPVADTFWNNTASYANAPAYTGAKNTPDIWRFIEELHPVNTTPPTSYPAVVTGG